MRKIIVSIIALFLAVSPVGAKEPNFFLSIEQRNVGIVMTITGQISPELVFEFIDKLTDIEESDLPKFIVVNSPGGLAWAGYKLGKLVSLMPTNPTWVVPANNICLSACAFAALGAKYLIIEPGGIFAIHKPFLPDELIEDISDELNQEALDSMLIDMTEYILSQGFNTKLAKIIASETDRHSYLLFESPKSLYGFFGKTINLSSEIKIISEAEIQRRKTLRIEQGKKIAK